MVARPFKPMIVKAAVVAAVGLSSLSASAAFTINLTFDPNVTAVMQPHFVAAKTFWEGIITGYQPGITLTGFTIHSAAPAIDGVGGILGSAGPTFTTLQAGFRLTTAGAMEFDSADIGNMITNGIFGDVIQHEMGHVLGIGTLWTDNGVYVNGTGKYTGTQALTAYKAEFVGESAATWVPVELTGGPGTANGHWAEVTGGAGPTGRVDGQGRDMQFELMTGWLNAPTYLSQTTVGSLRDIGYLAFLAPIPEPGTWAMLLLGIPLLAGVAAKRRRKAV